MNLLQIFIFIIKRKKNNRGYYMKTEYNFKITIAFIFSGIMIGFAQNLSQIGFLSLQKDYNFELIDFENDMSNGAIFENGKMYFKCKTDDEIKNLFTENALFIWDFAQDPECQNCKRIYHFKGKNVKSNGEFIVNENLQLYDILSGDVRVLPDNIIEDENNGTKSHKITFYKNQIFYFSFYKNYYHNLSPYYSFNIFSLRDNKYETFGQDYLEFFNKNDISCLDIFAAGNDKIGIVSFETIDVLPTSNPIFGNYYYVWDYKKNRIFKKVELPDSFEHIVGIDPFGNLYFSDVSFGNCIVMLSNREEFFDFLNPDDLKRRAFMKDTDFYEKDESEIICYYLNSNFDLYMSVKTEKGNYYFKVDYWEKLRKYYSMKSKAELRIIRNTVLAKYGRIFKSDDLKEYFNNQYWYKPDQDYTDSRLKENDKRAINMIIELEKKKAD